MKYAMQAYTTTDTAAAANTTTNFNGPNCVGYLFHFTRGKRQDQSQKVMCLECCILMNGQSAAEVL